jgi:hypothetical protein
MVKANVALLKEFVSTIQCVCKEQELRQLFSVSQAAFSRKRKLNFSAVTFIILSMLKKSLNIELQYFFEQTVQSGLQLCSKSAFCQQRQKISSEWFRFLLEYIARLFYQQTSLIKKWRDYKIISIDGSAAFLVNNKEVQQYYKGGTNQFGGYALARYMKMYDVLNGITLKAQLMPFDGSERLISYSWVDAIPADAITLFDRGFPAYTLFFLMQNSEAEKLFVMRCKKEFTNAVAEFAASDLDENIICFYPDDRAVNMLHNYHVTVNRTMGIQLRAVKILLADGSTEILLTNLFDKESFSNKELAALYRMRWMIETDIGKEKNLFQLENFSSYTRNSVEQDFYATFIAANIHQLIARQANKAVQQKTKNRKYKYQINTSASLAAFKQNLVKLYYGKNLKALLLHLQNVFEEFIEPIRPKRKITRIRRTRRRYGKHQTQTNYRNNL